MGFSQGLTPTLIDVKGKTMFAFTNEQANTIRKTFEKKSVLSSQVKLLTSVNLLQSAQIKELNNAHFESNQQISLIERQYELEKLKYPLCAAELNAVNKELKRKRRGNTFWKLAAGLTSVTTVVFLLAN